MFPAASPLPGKQSITDLYTAHNMPNQDIQQAAQLADASLELVLNPGKLSGDAMEQAIEKWKKLCEETVAQMGVSPQVQHLRDTLDLDNETLAMLCLVLLPVLDSRYIDLYKNLSGENALPTADVVTSLVTTSYAAKSALLLRLENGCPLFYWKFLVAGNADRFALSTLAPGKELVDYFSGAASPPPGDLLTLCTGTPLNLAADAGIRAIKDQIQIIRGGFEERQLTLAIRLAKNYYNQPLYRLNADIVTASPDPQAALCKALAYALLQNGLVYWQNGLEDLAKRPEFVPFVSAWLVPSTTILFMGEMEARDLPESLDPGKVGTLQLAPLTREMDKEVWQSMGNALLGQNSIDWELINNTYAMNMARIGQTLIRQKQTMDAATAPTTAALQDCYMATSPPDLAGLAYLDDARGNFAEMVLAGSTKKQLDVLQDAFLSRIFLDNDTPSGIVAIFQGDTGTGKTMAAESLAAALKLPLYRLDYTQLETSTESRLQEFFTEAAACSAALLFDEADVLFARKNDPAGPGSLITAFLIHEIESYSGLAILTTNAKQKIDPAFSRRATLVSFPPFTPQQRFDLFQKLMADKGVKIDSKVNLAALVSSLPLNGSNISSIVDNAILSARSDNAPLQDIVIASDDLSKAIQQEMQ